MRLGIIGFACLDRGISPFLRVDVRDVNHVISVSHDRGAIDLPHSLERRIIDAGGHELDVRAREDDDERGTVRRLGNVHHLAILREFADG